MTKSANSCFNFSTHATKIISHFLKNSAPERPIQTDSQTHTHTHTHSHNDTLLLSLAEQAQIKSIQKPFQITGLVTSYVETAF
jgi:hypothetical protein